MRGLGQKKKTLCTVYNLPTAIRNTYNLHLKSLEIRLRDGKVSEGSGILVKILKGNTTYFRSCHTVFLCSRTSQLVFTNMHRSVWKLEAHRLEHWFFFVFFFKCHILMRLHSVVVFLTCLHKFEVIFYDRFRKEPSMSMRIMFARERRVLFQITYTLHLSSPFCKLSYR